MKRAFRMFVLCLLMLLLLPISVSANSAEPPGIIVIVTGAPEDVELTLELPQETEYGIRKTRSTAMWEQYFRFYYHVGMDTLDGAVIRVTGGDAQFICPLPAGTANRYNNLMTLDFGAQTLTAGQHPLRQPLLVALRLTLTLMIEGAVFYLFGFRKKRSWVIFLLVNLATQLWLNIFIAHSAFSGGYWVFGYIGIELCIFLAESIGFPIFIKEKKAGRCILCALVANAVSLALGSWLISNLPV